MVVIVVVDIVVVVIVVLVPVVLVPVLVLVAQDPSPGSQLCGPLHARPFRVAFARSV